MDAEFAHFGGEPIFVDFAAAAEVFPGAVVCFGSRRTVMRAQATVQSFSIVNL